MFQRPLNLTSFYPIVLPFRQKPHQPPASPLPNKEVLISTITHSTALSLSLSLSLSPSPLLASHRETETDRPPLTHTHTERQRQTRTHTHTHTHTYTHTHTHTQGKLKWLSKITRLTAHFTCGLMSLLSALVICT